MKNKPDFVFFTGTEWTIFSQRTQSLAIEYARRGHRVFFIEPMLSASKILLYVTRLKSLRLPVVDQPNIFLLRPYFALSTFRGSHTQKMDRILFRRWYSFIKKKYNIPENPVIYINLPYWWSNIIDRTLFPKGKIVYDCIDECHVYSRNKRVLEIMEASEVKLAKNADLVLATAQTLYEKLKHLNSSVHLLTNGVDTNIFLKNSYNTPSDIASLPKPIFGFIGSLYHWIDLNVFATLAKKFPKASVVLIGPAESNEFRAILEKYKNIHYLGPRPYNIVPDYIYAIDICLNPFKMDRIGDGVNPLKLYEYLSLGKSVISSRTKEMEKFGEYVYLYSNPDELIKVAEKALSEQDEIISLKRIKFASDNSWVSKSQQILKLLKLQ